MPKVVQESQALARKKRFLVVRYALILLTGLVGYFETKNVTPWPVLTLTVMFILSNVYMGTLSPFSFFDATVQATVLVADTAMVSAILLAAGAGQEFFLFFFFVLLMAAGIQNLVTLGLAAVFVALLSLIFASMESGFLSPALVRAPFMLAASLFYGYVVLPERTGQMVRPLAMQRGAPKVYDMTAHVPPGPRNVQPGAGQHSAEGTRPTLH
jgi:hypothetical protein